VDTTGPPKISPKTPERKLGMDMGTAVGGLGCMGPQLFAGETYAGQTFYLAGAGAQEKAVLNAITNAVKQRGPGDMKVSVTQTKGLAGSARDVIAVRWSVAYGYIVCFAPGSDLFVSVRVNFVPGCLGRLIALLPGYTLEPNIFGVDDLGMMVHCLVTTTQEQLDALQLSYLSRDLTQER
jgi:hypothetical protein